MKSGFCYLCCLDSYIHFHSYITLLPFHILCSCFYYFIPVEDVSDLWPNVKNLFDERLPFKRACLNNKTRNPVYLEKLPAEYILTTDSRLRSRFPQEQSLFWFREPYATVVLVTCDVRNLIFYRF